ncbi:hypothetical protein [Colwellia ponticola]|uniref:Uncharacterized protein n=1 Tax=Colwellia ponticola TaxID=2304625 RepID=A0A8H2JKG8_9GAMM|nr:hypothetical protein [Colwellia ponticola]TMM43147.1 hypothetical protein FCS21_13545 [Colwellia ponticola]
MNKAAKNILLLLAAFFLFIGIMSAQNSKSYAELSDIQTVKGAIATLNCPPKGAASLRLMDSDFTYNLSVKFRSDYCDEDVSQALLGKEIIMESVQVNDDFYQVYKVIEQEKLLLSPTDVEADQSSSTWGLFFLSFFLTAIVIFKSLFKDPTQQ